MSLHNGVWVVDGQDHCIGFQRLDDTDLIAAVALTVPAGSRFCLVQCEDSTQSVRYRSDGTNPTAGVGMLMVAGRMIVYTGDPRKLKFIRTVAGAVLNVEYYS